MSKIFSFALDLLSRREHSAFELERKLSRKGFVVSDIEAALAKLAAEGLQSDDRFIESYVTMRSNKGFGPLRIKLELQERGIAQKTVEDFLKNCGLNWFELAKISRVKKFHQKMPANLKEKARQMRYLNYKGFSHDHINRIFKNDFDS